MFIDILKVRAKNFLSVGDNFLELDFKEFKKSLIIGKNGSGKSIWLDCIIFALYGKAYRNINKSALPNSINSKNCTTEIEFSINNKHYKIVRGIKPEVFKIYIDDVLLEQDAATKDYQAYLESVILKMDYKTACQMVIIGSMGYVPFLQLKSAERRQFIETILDLQLFTNMNKNLKLIQSEEKSKFTTSQNNLNIYKNKIETYGNIIKDLELNKDKKKDEIEVQLKAKLVEYKSYTATIDAIKSKFDAITYVDNSSELQSIVSEATSKIYNADSSNTKLKSRIKFFDTTPQCLSCEQAIDPSHKQKHIDEAESEVTNNDLIVSSNKIRKQEATDKLEVLNKLIRDKQMLGQQLKSNQDNAEWIKKDVVRLGKEKQALDTSDDSSLQTSKDELEKNKKLYKDEDKIAKEIQSNMQVYDSMLASLKDTGAKAQIIKKYIPIINATVNSYLDKFNLYVKFELDEQFNETLKSRYCDNYTYESFSQGERARIDMSMLFAWREITKVRVGIDTNLLIIDELMEIGDVELFKELLSIIDTKPNLNLFVISHKNDVVELFDNVIQMKKVKGFSKIAESTL